MAKTFPTSQISVVVPVYNRGARVLATIDSALAQTLLPLEIIVVDDGSTDQTPQILARAYADNPRVVLLRQENAGVAAARNFGLKKARGELVAFLDHDDLWHAEKLEAQEKSLREYSRAGACYCLWREVDESGNDLPDALQTTNQSWWKAREGKVFAWLFAPRNPLISMSVPLLRTQLLRDAGGFDARTAPADDWDLWLRLSRRTEFVFVPRVLVDYVRHENQQGRDDARMGRAMQRVFFKHPLALLRRPFLLWFALSFPTFQRSGARYQNAKNAFAAGDLRGAQRQARKVSREYSRALLSPQWCALLGGIALRKLRKK